MEEQVAGSILAGGIGGQYELRVASVERSKINAVLVGAPSRVIRGVEEEVFTVREKRGPAVRGVFSGIEVSGALRSSTCCADFPEGVAVVGSVDDDVVIVPGAAARIGGIGKYRCRSADRG